MKRTFNILLAAACLMLGGCVSGEHQLKLTPGYYAEHSVAVGAKLFRPGILYTTAAEDDYIYHGPAQSYLGRKATFHVSLGKITRAVAVKVLSAKFKKGVTAVNSLTGVSRQSLILHPRVIAYQHMMHWGFSGLNVTPQIDLILKMELLAPDHTVLYAKKYRSGVRTGEAFLSGEKAPAAVNKLTHETIFTLVQRFALDLEKILEEIH